MKTRILLTALAIGAAVSVTPVLAQDRSDVKPSGEAKDQPNAEAGASPKTSGDTQPSAVDPAQSSKTGANAGEGASYNRSNDKGDSPMPKGSPDKDK